MSLIVQKYGGTSVADSEKILAAARKAIRAQRDGDQVVVVVSAMGKTTDVLVDLANEICERPSAREMDVLLSTGEQVSVALLAMAVQSLGHDAVSLTGTQIGIRTDSTHTKARIRSISSERIQRQLDDGNIVIAAGFQGIDEDLNITTLGRGGSDTTAVALAAVLGADVCEIYTDVDGVYTTDPRLLPEARRVRTISYDEMLELASVGSGVMHNRAVEFAKKFGVPIHVRSSFSDITGTIIGTRCDSKDQPVCGAALIKNEARITLLGLPDTPGVSMAIFSAIAGRAVTVDMIVQNVGEQGKADISFTVLRDDLPVTIETVEQAIGEYDGASYSCDDQVSKVSVVGLGMARRTGVADQMFRALADANVNLQMITTSEIKISVLVSRDDAQLALRTVHQDFGLDKTSLSESDPEISSDSHVPPRRRDAAEIVARLANMEELSIDDVVLDESQARVTISGVADEPGVAASIFERIAGEGIFVDMIVQSFGRGHRAALSFTVPRTSLDAALVIANQLAEQFHCSGVTSSPVVAKLSVSGTGMRSHTGVAILMFESLAAEGINVEMINTSEVRVNVIVSGDRGAEGLICLKKVFAQYQQ